MGLSIRALHKRDTLRFIKSQWLFYKDDPHWVPPMLMDRKKLLNVDKNPFFKHSKIQLFLAEQDGKIVGRIAAIVNDNHNIEHNDTVGFFGFFECIQDQGVATSLITAAEQWLRSNGMTVIRGPVNPSLNDECGLLVNGFDGPPAILMTYNPPYYAQLIEGAGFKKSQDLYAYLLRNENYASEKVKRLFDVVVKRNELVFRSFDFKDKPKFKRDVETLKHIYNAAWEKNWGFVKFTDEEFDFLAADLKQIADPNLVFIVESKGRIAGFCLALPDVNQSLIHNKNGGLLRGAYHLLTKSKKIDLCRIIVLGVLPEFRNTGIDAAIYMEIGNRALSRGIKRGEASWILESNEMMNKGLTTTMHGERYRTYRLYDKSL
ncbi:MAG: GNAT family N-acetyltransferase [Candidatus Kapabacteria bacterium]|nr:GNAT family N-acetyltransferase [Candidatus Kapabacteria bacterium]